MFIQTVGRIDHVKSDSKTATFEVGFFQVTLLCMIFGCIFGLKVTKMESKSRYLHWFFIAPDCNQSYEAPFMYTGLLQNKHHSFDRFINKYLSRKYIVLWLNLCITKWTIQRSMNNIRLTIDCSKLMGFWESLQRSQLVFSIQNIINWA